MNPLETALAYIRRTYAQSHPHLELTETGDITPTHTTPEMTWESGPLTKSVTNGTVLLADERTN